MSILKKLFTRHNGFWLLSFLWLGFLILWRFQNLTNAYWRADDPALLNHALQSPNLLAFYDPQNWQKVSSNNLTPWVTLSFKLDLALGGLNPRVFYAHQLLALLALCMVVLGWLRRYLPLPWAVLVPTMFVAGAPTGAVVETLMTRHYLEGLLFSILALWAFQRAYSADSRPRAFIWLGLALLAYATATTAKEIYVPLPILLLTWPGLGSWRERLRLVAPFLVILGLYVLWRRYMLNGYVGGYVESTALLSTGLLEEFFAAIAKFPAFLWGEAWGLPVALLFAGILVQWRQAAWVMLLFFCVLAPLLPLVAFPGLHGPDRYLFLPWFVVTVLAVLVLHNGLVLLRSPPWVGVVAILMLLLPTWMQERIQQPSRQQSWLETEVQGRFLWSAPTSYIYFPSPALAASYWYATELCAMRTRERDSCPRPLLQGQDVIIPEVPALQYQNGAMVRLEPAKVAAALQVDRHAPLQANVYLHAGVARWHFGPAEHGRYYLVSPKFGRYPITARGSHKVNATFIEFHLLHEDQRGYVTASPLLRVTEGVQLNWMRY